MFLLLNNEVDVNIERKDGVIFFFIVFKYGYDGVL